MTTRHELQEYHGLKMRVIHGYPPLERGIAHPGYADQQQPEALRDRQYAHDRRGR